MKASVERCKAFLFDWDGTIVDSLPIKISNAAELFASRFGVSTDAVVASYQRHSGVPRRELFDRIANDCISRALTEDEFGELSAAFSELNRKNIAEGARLRPGALEALALLARMDRLVFISTATTQDEIEPLAEGFGVARYCTEVMGSRSGFTKGPIHARHVASRYGLQLEDLCGVGDDIQDMRLFQEAGMLAVGVTGTRTREELTAAGADLVVTNLLEAVPNAQ